MVAGAADAEGRFLSGGFQAILTTDLFAQILELLAFENLWKV